MEIRTTVSTTIDIPIQQKLKAYTPRCWEGCGVTKFSDPAESVEWYNHLGKLLVST